jgi:hypothetical protein
VDLSSQIDLRLANAIALAKHRLAMMGEEKTIAMPIAHDHPIEEWAFHIAQDVSEEMPPLVANAIERLGQSRTWLLHPPQLADELEEGGYRILGGVLELYSAMPPIVLPLVAERRQWEDANAFVRAFQDLSSKHHWSLDCYYRGELIGSIEDGIMGMSLTVGLLGEWKRVIDERSREEAKSGR